MCRCEVWRVRVWCREALAGKGCCFGGQVVTVERRFATRAEAEDYAQTFVEGAPWDWELVCEPA